MIIFVFFDFDVQVVFDEIVKNLQFVFICEILLCDNVDWMFLDNDVVIVGWDIIWEDCVILGLFGVLDIEVMIFCLVGFEILMFVGFVNIYGGGMIVGYCFWEMVCVVDIVVEYGVVVVNVEYCFVLEDLYFVGVEDCYVVFEWMCVYVMEFGIDLVCIVVGGGSVGGGFIVVVVLLVCDWWGLVMVGQLLLCFMIDNINIMVVSWQYDGIGIWQCDMNFFVWLCVFGEEFVFSIEVFVYVVLSCVMDVFGFLFVYIEVGEVEMFCDEDIEYVLWIWVIGGQVELYVWGGGVYGFDMYMLDVEIICVVFVVCVFWL